jgi:flagellar assembly protein FliH
MEPAMAMPQKFSFDVSFDHLGTPTARSLTERRFTRAEMDATRQAALAEGHAAGLAEAAQSAESLTADALAKLAASLAALFEARDATALETERRALGAMQTIIAKLIPGIAAKDPLAEVEAFTTKCLHEAIDEPRVVLRIAEEIYEPLRERLDNLANAAGYAGRIVLLADDAIVAGDARVEWADGGAERNLVGQCAELTSLLDGRRDPAATPNPVSA